MLNLSQIDYICRYSVRVFLIKACTSLLHHYVSLLQSYLRISLCVPHAYINLHVYMQRIRVFLYCLHSYCIVYVCYTGSIVVYPV